MAKSKAQKTHEDRIRNMMADAGLYEPRYELQIEQTGETLREIDEIKKIIGREGRTVKEMKTNGVGEKMAFHPLYTPLNNYQQLLLRQMAALGLNKLSEKKSEAKEPASPKKDGVMSFLEGRRR